MPITEDGRLRLKRAARGANEGYVDPHDTLLEEALIIYQQAQEEVWTVDQIRDAIPFKPGDGNRGGVITRLQALGINIDLD